MVINSPVFVSKVISFTNPSLFPSFVTTCFPRKDVCVKCLRDDSMEDTSFGPYATLDSYAVLHVAPTGFTPPYIQGYVIVDDGPKVFTLISGCDPKDDVLELGQRMELVIEQIKKDESGNDVIGWKFRPAKENTLS